MPEINLDAVVAEIVAMGNKELTISLSAPLAYGLIANLQLAMRRPENETAMADEIRLFTDRLIETLAPDNTPLRHALLAGYDPEQDIPS